MESSKKKENIRKMFDEISPRYDFLNHFLSAGIDRWWRSRLVKLLAVHKPQTILDVATGTGDLAIALLATGAGKVNGIDISPQMLEVGRRKMSASGLDSKILLQEGDAEAIPFPAGTFDAVTVAFGVRNFENLANGLAEMHRVLRPGGHVFVLEFSRPQKFPVRQVYGFYSRFVIPFFGKMISGHSHAYSYLPESVAAFPSGGDFLAIMNQAGFSRTRDIRLTMGIASIYCGQK